MAKDGKWVIKATPAEGFDPTLLHLCDHPGCKVQIAHVHDEQGRIIRESINWEYLDSLSDSGMKTAIGGDIAAFLNSLTPEETNR